MSAFSAPYFHDEAAAYAELEATLWPHGPVCPHCGGMDRITEVKGKTARMGLRRCGPCKRQFTVTVGTVFESSHVPLNKWLQAAYQPVDKMPPPHGRHNMERQIGALRPYILWR